MFTTYERHDGNAVLYTQNAYYNFSIIYPFLFASKYKFPITLSIQIDQDHSLLSRVRLRMKPQGVEEGRTHGLVLAH